MDNTPAGEPPAGIVPNLVNPPSDGYLLLIIGSVMIAVMFVTGGLSFYAKLFIRKKMGPEDWSRLIAMIGTCIYFAICIFAVVKGKYGTHIWDLSAAHVASDEFIISGYFSNWVTTIVWPFAKMSFFLFYLDVFRSIRWQRYAIYFGLVINWAFYVAILIATLYFTTPAPGQSWQESFVSARYAGAGRMTIPIASGSLALDLYILTLPMIPIWTLHMSPKKKIGVCAVFATGVMACVASSLSIYFKNLLDRHSTDFSYYTLPVLIMCLVEMCVGITASSMPSMALLFRNQSSLFSRIFTKIASIFQSNVKPEVTEQLPLREFSPQEGYCHIEDEISIQTYVSSGKTPHGLDDNQIFSQRVFSQEVEQGPERLEWLRPEE